MRAANYSTHAIGKWHLGNGKWANTPHGRGFDTYLGYLQGQTDYYNRTVLSCGKFACLYPINCKSGFKIKNPPQCENPRASPYGPDADGYDFWRNNGVALDHHGQYTVDDYDAEFKRIVQSRDPSKPMFVYYAEQLLHIPLEAPPEPKYVERCVAEGVVGGYKGTNRTILCAMAARMDDAVASMVSTLKESGMWDNTLIFALSDNGGMTAWGDAFPTSASSNYPLRGGKTTVFEGGVRSVSWVNGDTSHLMPGQKKFPAFSMPQMFSPL